jgi:prepilin-type N-terminal cleavage/methylation domain-containing protein
MLKNKGFTLAEVLITLTIIGVVASLTIPVVTKKALEQETVSKVKKYYRNIADTIQQWQVEEGCTDNIGNCLERYEKCDTAFVFLENKLKVLDKRGPNVSLSDIQWLADKTVLLNGAQQTRGWEGNSKVQDQWSCHYLLSDGVTMNVLSDSGKKSGLIIIDVNGPKPPNRMGKDTFPIGIGAYNNNKYRTVHPYFNEDNGTNNGNCNIINNGDCNPDVCTKDSCSPTAYVLKYSKLPPITW